MTNILKIEDIEVKKKFFYSKIYTKLSDAIEILKERQEDKQLVSKIEKILNNNIPEPLKMLQRNGIIFRQVATPNFEIRWFIDLTITNNLNPIFFEYHSDKFTSNNSYKHSLAQLRIHNDKRNINGDNIEHKVTIVDFNKYNGKKIDTVLTLKGEKLVDFHKSLFNAYNYSNDKFQFFNASDWFEKNGSRAIDYYTNFILLFTCHGILFENFLFIGSECEFTNKVLLPAFEKAMELSGYKPLIVPIPPMDKEVEEDIHWHSYSHDIDYLINK